jgi:hypothetical protein
MPLQFQQNSKLEQDYPASLCVILILHVGFFAAVTFSGRWQLLWPLENAFKRFGQIFELAVDSKRVDETLRKIGVNWQRRNLEMVFHAKVIGNAPSPSGLIAWHVW